VRTLLAVSLGPVRALFVVLTLLASPLHASAQVSDAAARLKIAPDLLTTVGSSVLPVVPWAKLLNGELLVRAIVVGNSDDRQLTDLRRYIVSVGGAVSYNYTSIRALAVMVPASHLVDVARRSDVTNISPSRAVTRTASLLQTTTGAADARMTTSSGLFASSSTPDGSGVGIAFLDSGIAWSHQSVSTTALGLKGLSHVKQAIDFVQIGKGLTDLSWVKGSDQSMANLITLDGTQFTPALSLLQQPRLLLPDPYGHGTHVASIAAGSGSYQYPDTTGIAPNADLYDIRVLDEDGVGNLADVIAGIDWVTQHAKLLNIRVMNLSLAASSTESFLTDPPARAARAAAASRPMDAKSMVQLARLGMTLRSSPWAQRTCTARRIAPTTPSRHSARVVRHVDMERSTASRGSTTCSSRTSLHRAIGSSVHFHPTSSARNRRGTSSPPRIPNWRTCLAPRRRRTAR
jgi:serine protease AprX